MTSQRYIIVIATVLLLLAGSYYFYTLSVQSDALDTRYTWGNKGNNAKEQIITIDNKLREDNEDSIQNITEDNTNKNSEEVKIEPLQYGIPNLSAPLNFNESIPKNVRNVIQKNVNDLRTKLTKDPTSVQDWMALALQYKMIGSYDMARDIWEFLTKTDKQDSLVYYNLGVLYHIRIKDFKKSEDNLLKAIEIDPARVSYRLALYDLYKYSYKINTDLAERTLLDSIKEIPNSIDLFTKAASYYEEKKEIEKAIDYYKLARDLAYSNNNSQLAEDLSKEIKRLSK